MQRRRRYDLKLSGLTGHVLDLFLLLTNSPDPTTGYASSWSGLLDGKLCAQTIWQWVSGLLFWNAMIFEAPLMKRLYGSGLGTGTYIFEASWAYFFRQKNDAMIQSAIWYTWTSRNNNIQLSNTFQLCLCTYSICLYYYYNYDDIQIQSACIMIVW